MAYRKARGCAAVHLHPWRLVTFDEQPIRYRSGSRDNINLRTTVHIWGYDLIRGVSVQLAPSAIIQVLPQASATEGKTGQHVVQSVSIHMAFGDQVWAAAELLQPAYYLVE